MCHSRTLDNEINKLHRKALRLNIGTKPAFLLKTYLKNETVNINPRNLQMWASEIYKIKNDLASDDIMKDMFHFVEKPYNLGNNSALKRRRNRSIFLGTETISSFAPKIWKLVSNAIKNATSLELFKKN